MTAGTQATAILDRVRERDLRLVRFLWCGNDGIVRGKGSGIHGLEGRLASGVGLTVGLQAMNALDQLQPVDGMGPVGEVRLVPDLDTFVVLPYAPRSGALLTSHRTLDGAPAPVCQRSFLQRQIDRLAERGLRAEVAFENEFTLAEAVDDVPAPVDQSLYASTVGFAAAAPYVDALLDALDRQGIVLEQYYPELGHGQQEISTTHRPALRAADEQILVRETIRGVATARGQIASLSPKPWSDAAGNGGHIHVSLWDAEREDNRLYDGGDEHGLSREARAFIAGVLDHLPGLCALTAPSVASYQRIVPAFWAGAFTCWGFDNREAPVRVPSVFGNREEASTNIELKAADATCNPYLAVGGLLAAGLDGLERELTAPEPVQVDPATLAEGERTQRGIARLPESQGDALDALEADTTLTDALGPVLAGSYVAVRRSEGTAYAEGGEAMVQAGHFQKY